MNITEFIVLIGVFLSAVSYVVYFNRGIKNSKTSVYRCPHTDVKEFSGGYRDPVTAAIAPCTYNIRVTVTINKLHGRVTLMCPEHGSALICEDAI